MAGKIKYTYNLGDTYGWLTVLGEGERTNPKVRTIRVQCRCGRIYDTATPTFKRPEPKCFCCANKIKAQSKVLELVGKTYGNWDVIEKGPTSPRGNHQYYCRCKRCGELSLRTQYAITHYTKNKCPKCRPDFHFRIIDDYAIGTLPSGDEFIIDAEDIERVSQFWWYKKPDQNYVICDLHKNGKLLRRIRLHRFLMNVLDEDRVVVDHINRNSFDCRKSNMRIATQSQNCLNKSMHSKNTTGYIGVQYIKSSQTYTAEIGLATNTIMLGSSKEKIECAQMYNEAAKLLYRQFAGQLNDVPAEVSDEIKKQVYEKCKPYFALSDSIVQPVTLSEHNMDLATQMCGDFYAQEKGKTV
jgi:hypothetical protein